jgi:hypothetical protein
MYVHEEKRVAFIAHPRTASTATGQALTGLGFGQWINHHGFDPKWDLTGWTVFATVRNPFDLMVSWYYHKKRHQEQTFQEWLPKFIALSNQYLDQGMFFGTNFCTRMMRYETLQKDFDFVLGEVGFPQTDIPLKNVSHDRPDKPLSEYYDHRLINLMRTHFNKEIRQNGYKAPCQAT